MSLRKIRQELSQSGIFVQDRNKPRTGIQNKSQSPAQSYNLMAAKDSVLFTWSNNELRCFTLGQNEYKTLQISVSFDVKSLLLNTAGSLLAIVGESEVVVAVMPESSFFLGTQKCLKTRHKRVRPADDCVIKKVLWNPIAQYDSNLIVFTDDQTIRAYDLSWNYEEPEQVVRLVDEKDINQSFEIHEDELDDPVSIALGPVDVESNPLSAFTLYVLNGDGNIFSLCPFVPHRFIMSRDHIEALFDSSVLDHHERQTSAAQKQLLWCSGILKQSEKSPIETVLKPDGTICDYHILERPSRNDPKLQGPHVLQPYPKDLYEGSSGDLVAIRVGAHTGLVVSADSRRINLFVQLQSSCMYWEGSSGFSDDTFPKLALLESVQLPTNQTQRRRFNIQNNLVDNSIEAFQGPFAYRLVFTNWNHVLSSTSTQSIIQCPGITVVELLGNADVSGYFGSATLRDIRGSEYTVVKSNVGLYVEGAKSFLENENQKSVANSLLRQEEVNFSPMKTVPEKAQLYKTLVEDNREKAEVERLLTSINIEVPATAVDKTTTVQPTIDLFEFFVKLSTHVSGELGKLHDVGAILHSRLELQRAELNRQLKRLKELTGRVEDLKENASHDRLEACINRQHHLHGRSDKLLERISKQRALLLSEKEHRWFAELKRLQNRIYGLNGGLDRRLTIASHQVKVLSREVQFQTPQVSQQSGMDFDSTMKLRAMLTKEEEMVAGTKGHLQELMNQITKRIRTLDLDE